MSPESSERLGESNSRGRQPGASSPYQEAAAVSGAIEGDLAVATPFELLQIFGILRRSGTLRFRRADGLTASCDFVDGSISTAECGHLRDAEAVCTLVWWKAGFFRFEPCPEREGARAGSKPEALMLEASRVADELERRAASLPGPDAELRLASLPMPTADPLDCGLLWVCEFIRRNPGTTRAAVERSLSLAPARIRLALAVAMEEGRIGTVSSETSETSADRGSDEPSEEPAGLWARGVARFGRTIRVVVACSPVLVDELSRALCELVEALDLPRQRLPISVSHPSFLRIRPPGGILSLTVLPVSPRNRFAFEALAQKVELAVVAADRETGEVAKWLGAVPERTPVVVVDGADLVNPTRSADLRDLLPEVPR